MAIIAKSSGEGTSFEPAPSGVHQAVCVDVQDLGVLEVTWQGTKKQQHKINVAWQIAEEREDGKPFLVFKRYTLSLHEKSGLRKDLESWRGRKFTREEEMGFDVEKLIGVNCLLNIQHNQVADRTYANVVSIMPLVKGMPTMAAREYVRKQDRPTPDAHNGGTSSAPVPAPSWDEPPLTDDDIPFAWLLPLLLPILGMGLLS